MVETLELAEAIEDVVTELDLVIVVADAVGNGIPLYKSA